ncbi:MAG TPA: flagellar FlbD family protein [Solirubrobacteraceae bacterium]|nr:flagellar FlbD family protein [Solirubrobacteraceae bacterium]
MITLHRLGHKLEIFRLNPDLIVTVEATPDTVITLATGAKIVVAETPERVAKAVREYRVDILAEALKVRHDKRRVENPRLAPVRIAAEAGHLDNVSEFARRDHAAE